MAELTVLESKLGEVIGLDANTVVLLLNGLEEKGYAVRERDPNDRRRHLVRITPAGVKALVRGDRAVEAVTDDVFASLDPDERAQLGSLLAKTMGEGALAVTPDG